jgi:hypothetical protein
MNMTAKGFCQGRNISVAVALAAVILSGCTKAISRMDANFNAQNFGPPQQSPPPTPPKDQFIWIQGQPLNSTVVSNPSGGHWVRTVPDDKFIRDPDVRHQFLLANSEPFTRSPLPGIRGTFSIRIVGQDEVDFGLQAVASETGFVGGGSLEANPFGDLGDVGILYNPAVLNNLAAWDGNFLPVTAIATYQNGKTVDFYYTLEQVSHTFHLSVGGGALGSDSATYISAGPIAQLGLWLFLRRVARDTQVFVDNITMEELN